MSPPRGEIARIVVRVEDDGYAVEITSALAAGAFTTISGWRTLSAALDFAARDIAERIEMRASLAEVP